MTFPKQNRRDFVKTAAASGAFLAAPMLMTRAAHGKAEMLGPSQATHHRFKLGEFEVTTFLDANRTVPGPHPIFGQDQSAEAVAELMKENRLPSDQAMFYFTPVVVNTGNELVLFDTGLGGENGQVAKRMADAGYSPEQIDVVVITHFHPDHIGGLMADGKPTYANARYVTGEAEMNFWTSDAAKSGPTENVANLVAANVVPLQEKATMIKDEGEVVSGIRGLAAFGHTPGHMVYHLESAGRRLLISADTANHFVASLQRPDWHVKFDMDKDAAAATRKKVFGMAAADGIPFSGYHMPFPAVGFVEEMGPGFRYVAESYQMEL